MGFSNDNMKEKEIQNQTITNLRYEIRELNREVKRLEDVIQTYNNMFNELFEPKLQALQKVKDNLDKYVVKPESDVNPTYRNLKEQLNAIDEKYKNIIDALPKD